MAGDRDPDVIVVGAGACGPVVAKEFAEKGVRVLMLEARPWLDPDRDFSLLEVCGWNKGGTA